MPTRKPFASRACWVGTKNDSERCNIITDGLLITLKSNSENTSAESISQIDVWARMACIALHIHWGCCLMYTCIKNMKFSLATRLEVSTWGQDALLFGEMPHVLCSVCVWGMPWLRRAGNCLYSHPSEVRFPRTILTNDNVWSICPASYALHQCYLSDPQQMYTRLNTIYHMRVMLTVSTWNILPYTLMQFHEYASACKCSLLMNHMYMCWKLFYCLVVLTNNTASPARPNPAKDLLWFAYFCILSFM